MNSTHDKFIDNLGGTKEVAKLTSQLQSTVANWRMRGIPWRWRGNLANIAATKSVPLPPNFNGDPVEAA
jgi:hypothetical protein